MTLRDIEIGESAVIDQVGGEGELRQHFLDMGMVPGAKVTIVKYAPMGDPVEVRIHGYELTLRLEEAAKIGVRPCTFSELHADSKAPDIRKVKSPHPGIGEGGRHHLPDEAEPLDDGTVLTFALMGNQNCGKTTLFNQLTGSNQHVGNFPGVTVSRKDGRIRGYANSMVTDLPGIYSMSPFTSEELVSRNHVLTEHPKAIINIVDATNIERNLYLTMQLLEMNIPMVVALNMMDEVLGNQGYIDVNKMEAGLGVPVIPISASKNEGVNELIYHAVHIAKNQERPRYQDLCGKEDHKGAVHRCIHAVVHLIEDHAERAGLPVRFAAMKAIEGDSLIIDQLELDKNELELLEHILIQMEQERGLDRKAAIADMRFHFIEKLCSETVVKPRESRERIRSERLDRIFTGKYTAIPCFIGIMLLVFVLTFNVIGARLQGILESVIEQLTTLVDMAMTAGKVNPVLHSLVVNGIFKGVGSVLSFLPIIVTLFFFLSIMEDSGYIARIAFVMDKLLRKIGLSGRSIVPLLIGFGCTVPAVMSTRTLPSARDRHLTVLMTPFMSCTAKLPVYAFLVNAFFPKKGGLIMGALYLFGICTGILVALVSKLFVFRGEAVPFVMELPNYRLPGAGNVARLLWEKARDFLQKAFSVILIASIVVWFMQTFDLHMNITSDSSKSILAVISGAIAPVMAPLGLGKWQICVSLISGFIAKESVVAMMEVLYAGNIAAAMTPAAAVAMLVFCLLYTPCVAAVSAIRREMGAGAAVFVVLFQCAVAWAAAFLVRSLFMMAGVV